MKRKFGWILPALFVTAMALQFLTVSRPALAVGDICRVCVKAGTDDAGKELEKAGAVADLYILATSPSEGRYEFIGGGDTEMPADADGWRAMAQTAAAASVGKTVPVVSGAKLGEWVTTDDTGADLQPGLYLLVARPADAEDGSYLKSFETGDGSGYLASEIRSDAYSIRIMPEIVAVPAKEPDEDGHAGTADDKPWIYDVEVFLKPELEKRMGSIEIVKELLTYETAHDAMFLFQVEAMLDGKNVYSNLVSIRFTAPGEKKVLVENIPVGADVTVSEVYSTPGYRLTSDRDQYVTVDAERILSVRFENDYDGNRDHGGGIMNHFDYDLEKGEWTWVQQ